MNQPGANGRKQQHHRILSKSLMFCALAFLVLGLSWWLFRSESSDNRVLGKVTYHFSWGKLSEISADSNRDGLVDAKLIVVSYDNKPGSTNFDVIESWESSNLNGKFDVHYWTDSPSGELILEMDLDDDGIFEKRFTGKEAEAQLLRIRNNEVTTH